jgi:predicted nucleotidyltransferase
MATDMLIEGFVRKIVRGVDPDAIVLFGSHARNQAGVASDVDLLVIHRGPNLRYIQKAAYAALSGRTIPVDIIVRSPDDLEDRLTWPDPFVINLVKEGRVLYAKPHSPGVDLFRTP